MTRNDFALRAVRFTFSDVRIWSELDQILITQASDEPEVVPDILESCCVTLAGLGFGVFSFLGKGGIRMDGNDDLALPVSSIHSSEPTPELEMNESPSLGATKPDEPTHRVVVEVTLTLLSVIHRHVDFLNGRLSDLIAEKRPFINHQLIMYPRDISSFDLSSLSELDSDFLCDFAQTRMRDESVRVSSRRSWKDILSMWFS
jgi:hypothetical protein